MFHFLDTGACYEHFTASFIICCMDHFLQRTELVNSRRGLLKITVKSLSLEAYFKKFI